MQYPKYTINAPKSRRVINSMRSVSSWCALAACERICDLNIHIDKVIDVHFRLGNRFYFVFIKKREIIAQTYKTQKQKENNIKLIKTICVANGHRFHIHIPSYILTKV